MAVRPLRQSVHPPVRSTSNVALHYPRNVAKSHVIKLGVVVAVIHVHMPYVSQRTKYTCFYMCNERNLS